MTRLVSSQPNRVESYVGGINENAPPAAATNVGVGTVDQAKNFFATPAGKLAVRGGSQVKQTLTCNRALYLRSFTPTGAIALAHVDGSTNHKIWRLTSDLSFFTGVEATSSAYAGASWVKATPARPVGAELFEKMFVCDATLNYSARSGLFSIDAAGTITAVSFDLGGGAEQLKPYVCEEYNNHLFVAGYENKTLSADSPAILRHSYLGVSPEAAGGFDSLAYLYVGAKGQRINGLKKGRGLLLVAKANELYRVSGFGVGKPGWTFAIEAVSNTQGWGVSNPYALCFAGEYWYGIGESGPFRTDGFKVDSLVGARSRSWDKITHLEYSWVCYHPDRDAVLFGMNQTPVPTGRSATYPTVIWVWDCQREVWASDIEMTADMMYAQAISAPSSGSSAILGPTGLPSALAFTHASADLTSVAATWANGDATATTELWLRNSSGGSSALWSTAAAAATTASLTGLTAGQNYKVKIRHVKNGVASDFTAEVDAYTVMHWPSPFTWDSINRVFRAGVNVAHGQIIFEKDSVESDRQDVPFIGTYNYTLWSSGFHVYRSRLFDAAWPAAIQYSAYSDVLPVTI